MKHLTFATVQVGNYLGRGREYATKLLAGVRRHMPAGIELRRVCFTDDASTVPEGVDPIAVPAGIAGWWNKLAMFRPGAFKPGERVLFSDLDTIVVGSLVDIASYSGPFATLRDIYRPTHMGSGLMAWEAGRLDHLWTVWDSAGRPSTNPGGDQQWIELMQSGADYWQDMLPGQVASFKRDARPLGRVPDGARVLVYHGQPRPHEPGEAWAQELWNGIPAAKAA